MYVYFYRQIFSRTFLVVNADAEFTFSVMSLSKELKRVSPLVVWVLVGSDWISPPHQYKGPFYIGRQSQRCNNSAMTLRILFSLKTLQLLQNGLQPILE